MACLQTSDSKTAIKQQPATNRIIGPIFRSPKAKKKKSEEWKQTKIMEISCSTKEWKESRENCRHFLGAAAAAVKSRRLFSLPHVDNRIRISDADTKVEKKLKIEFFFTCTVGTFHFGVCKWAAHFLRQKRTFQSSRFRSLADLIVCFRTFSTEFH